jgi:DNA topoisomerase-1
MPRKQKKTKEERTAEGFFPVDKDDLRYAIEKEVKEVRQEDLERIEVPGKRKTARKPAARMARKSSGKLKAKAGDFSPQKISLKEDGYELIITEKPQAAMKISSALGDYEKKSSSGVPYYDVDRKGKKIVVACAVGHLFTLSQTKKSGGVPVFDIKWVPSFTARKKDFTKRYYDTILKLAKGAGSVTIATDYDVEGEVIGMNIMRFACGQKDANRMKFSTLTDRELNESYENKAGSINWGQAIAGETRHFLDWIYGINLSRAIMNAIKATGKFMLMSIGRVQGPALRMIVEKERQIKKFRPEKYWQAFITIVPSNSNGPGMELKHSKDISKKSDLKRFQDLKGREVIVDTEKREQVISPLPPFNLTALQTEAYRVHGITPSRTLVAAQSLYLSGLISYPRTSSQKLPSSISYGEIIEKVAEKYNAGDMITRKNPVEGKKTDPAHPSIHPTGNFQILSGDEEKIYNLVARRFIALFCDDAVIDNKKISTMVDGMEFNARGSSIRKRGWTEIYPIDFHEKDIPDLKGKAKIKDVRTEEKETQPPKRYSPASIILELEKRNLGTKATRTSIIDTLYGRNYISGRSIEATPLGMSLIDAMEKYSPVIIDENLTRNFEKEMVLIQEAKRGFEDMEERVIRKAESSIRDIMAQFEKNGGNIGAELLSAKTLLNQQRKEESKITKCPVCENGMLAINYSKKNGKYFVACNGYPECRNTYPLPPGLIKNPEPRKGCESCSWPMLLRIKAGRRPWEFCFNPACEKNRERIEEYRRRKELEAGKARQDSG